MTRKDAPPPKLKSKRFKLSKREAILVPALLVTLGLGLLAVIVLLSLAIFGLI